MNLEKSSVQNWTLLRFPDRIDALNFQEFITSIELTVESRQRVAFDMRRVQFINFQALRYLHNLAQEFAGGGSEVALVGPSEKLKRQFALFCSLDPFRIFSSNEWTRLQGAVQEPSELSGGPFS